MANQITAYDVLWYANTFIERMEHKLTLIPAVGRQLEEKAREHGSTIQFKRQGPVPAQNMPVAAGAESDLTPQFDQMKLDQWKGSQFKLGDLELAYSGEEIIQNHIDPAVHSVTEAIETTVIGLGLDIANVVDYAQAGNAAQDFIACRKVQNALNVPNAGRVMALNFEREAAYLNDNLFLQANTGADGSQAQREGYLGRKFGYDTFTSPLLGDFTTAAVPLSKTGGNYTVVAQANPGDSTLTVTAAGLAGNVVKGDIIASIAGYPYPIAINANAAVAGGNIVLALAQKVESVIAAGAVVTFDQKSHGMNLGFQKDAFNLVMAPLSDAGNGKGAEVGVVTDPQTGLAIRVMRWYDPQNKVHKLSFDALWGVKTVDAKKAVRLRGPVI